MPKGLKIILAFDAITELLLVLVAAKMQVSGPEWTISSNLAAKVQQKCGIVPMR